MIEWYRLTSTNLSLSVVHLWRTFMAFPSPKIDFRLSRSHESWWRLETFHSPQKKIRKNITIYAVHKKLSVWNYWNLTFHDYHASAWIYSFLARASLVWTTNDYSVLWVGDEKKLTWLVSDRKGVKGSITLHETCTYNHPSRLQGLLSPHLLGMLLKEEGEENSDSTEKRRKNLTDSALSRVLMVNIVEKDFRAFWEQIGEVRHWG